jgi:hypothetical protein
LPLDGTTFIQKPKTAKERVSEMIRNALDRFSTQLVDPTAAELSTQEDLKAYRVFSKSIKSLATSYQDGINSD